MSLLGFLTVTKILLFFHWHNIWPKIKFFGILSICGLIAWFCDTFHSGNRGFGFKLSVLVTFCGKKDFGTFSLFSQSVKKNWKYLQKLLGIGKFAVNLWRFWKMCWTHEHIRKMNRLLINFIVFLINNYLYYYHERWENYGRPGG